MVTSREPYHCQCLRNILWHAFYASALFIALGPFNFEGDRTAYSSGERKAAEGVSLPPGQDTQAYRGAKKTPTILDRGHSAL